MKRQARSFWITVRYQGECSVCGRRLEPGQRAIYDANKRRVECGSCGQVLLRREVPDVARQVA